MYYSFKKICFLTITSLSLSFISCSSEYDIDNEGSTVAQKGFSAGFNTDTRSYEEALTIAQNSISMVESSDNQTRSTSKHRSINEKGGVFTVSSSSTSTRTGNAANDTLLYVFNFNDDQGFAVVSANRNTEGLLAITESGFYSPNKETDNPGFDMYMKMAKDYIQNSNVSLPATRGGTYNYWKGQNDTLEYSRVEPKVPVKWGQRGIAGSYCSNQTAGCGPIAMAQIMSYYQQPTTFIYTFGNRDINSENVNWNIINQHVRTGNHEYPVCVNNPNLDKTIGRICRELGIKSHSTYYDDCTTNTNRGAMYDVLTYYGYKVLGFNRLPNTDGGFLNDLQADKLILMCGRNKSGNGHYWLVDGIIYYKVHTTRWTSQDGINWTVSWDSVANLDYNHINWGKDSEFNGYFLGFDAKSPKSYDPDNVSYYNLNEDLDYYREVLYTTVYY